MNKNSKNKAKELFVDFYKKEARKYIEERLNEIGKEITKIIKKYKGIKNTAIIKNNASSKLNNAEIELCNNIETKPVTTIIQSFLQLIKNHSSNLFTFFISSPQSSFFHPYTSVKPWVS